MASRESRRAQRETATRVREFRAGRGYQSAIPSSVKAGARAAYTANLDAIAAMPASQRTPAQEKQLAQATSWGAHGRKAYQKYDTPENRKTWYHNKK